VKIALKIYTDDEVPRDLDHINVLDNFLRLVQDFLFIIDLKEECA
jgi:hypothetical protein